MARVLKALHESKLRLPGNIRYLDCADGVRLFGEGPTYLALTPAPKAWLLKIDAPDPDKKAIYQNLNALEPDGRIKRDIYDLATIPIEDNEAFRTRTRKAFSDTLNAIQAGNIEEAEKQLRFYLMPSVDFALEACSVLQIVREYLRAHDAKSEELLAKFISRLKAARKFKTHETRGGTAERNRDLTHGEFEDAIRVLTERLGRPPFRCEIADETGESLRLIRKKLSGTGLAWIPAKGRGPAKSRKTK